MGRARPDSYREPPDWVTEILPQNSDWFMLSLLRNSLASSPDRKTGLGLLMFITISKTCSAKMFGKLLELGHWGIKGQV